MAIINCEECGKEISDKSPACIHCGNPIEIEGEQHIESEITQPPEKPAEKGGAMGWLGCLGAIIFLILLGQCAAGGGESFDPTNPDHLDIIFDE